MVAQNRLTDKELSSIKERSALLNQLLEKELHPDDVKHIQELWKQTLQQDNISRDAFNLHPLSTDIDTALILVREIGTSRAAFLGIMLNRLMTAGLISLKDIEQTFGQDVRTIVEGLTRINELYQKLPALTSAQFVPPFH